MKKKLLFISLALAMVLTALSPAMALAAKPVSFSADGIIVFITPGDVSQAGKSSRFVVTERQIIGEVAGDIGGPLVFTYRGNVDVQTQAGTIHGTVIFPGQPYVLDVNGRIEPVELAPIPEAITLVVAWYVPFPPYVFPAGTPLPAGTLMPKLSIPGRWIFTEGAKGQGALDAWVQFTTDAGGHINYFYFSAFDLTGKWQE